MIREAAVSAPGKAILIGEHAAVYGHPAILASIDLRLTATVRSGPDGVVRIELPDVGFTGATTWDALTARARERRRIWSAAFESGDGTGFEPLQGPQELALIAAGEVAGRAGTGRLPGASIRVDSAIPPGAGCGSSAALALAVAAALDRSLGLRLGTGELRRVALAVERQQHGRPSGVDVEAVMRGGVVWCRGGADGAGEALPCLDGRLACLRLFHSGAPRETTGEMVARVRLLEKRDPLRLREALGVIDAATHGARDALSAGSYDRLADAIRNAEHALESLGVVPEEVARAIRAVEASGGAAKISGAGGAVGGGGLVIVAYPDEEAHARFVSPAAWSPLHAELAVPGLETEATA